MTWLPKGKPCFDCREVTLDFVTTMASTIKPIWIPTMALDKLSGADCVPPAGEERMLFSNKRYRTPMRTISMPPSSLKRTSVSVIYQIGCFNSTSEIILKDGIPT